jgi:hypothetical protein
VLPGACRERVRVSGGVLLYDRDIDDFAESFDRAVFVVTGLNDEAVFARRQAEADAFYTEIAPYRLSDERRAVQRQALAGGEVEMAFVNPSGALTQAYRGTGLFSQPLPVRVVASYPSIVLERR